MTKQKKSYTVREALKLALRWYRVGKDTGNKDLQRDCRAFVRKYIASRHSTSIHVMNPF